MEKQVNILVFPCGAENALEIHSSLKDVVNLTLFGASGREDHGSFLFKNYIENVPYISSPAFVDVFNDIIVANNIDVVFPAHDDVALFLARRIKSFKARIAVPGLRAAEICRSKRATYHLYEHEDFCPIVYDSIDSSTKFPVYVKPDCGQGGKGGFVIPSIGDPLLPKAAEYEFVITEYLPGDEFTIDCFTDRHGVLRFAGPRKRSRIFGGISVGACTVPLSQEIERIAEKISSSMEMRGLWYFQLKRDHSNKFKLLEVSVRTASSMGLYRGLGVNFPLLTVYDLMDIDVEILENDYFLQVDRALTSRYKSTLEYDTVYIDFDDTITKRGQINPFVMLFLYHVKNNHKKIKLLTKHEFDLQETFAKYSIHPSMFDEIIVLGAHEKKSDKIVETTKVIFIDNAYKERVEVKKKLNIAVFDVDAIGTLVDWRE